MHHDGLNCEATVVPVPTGSTYVDDDPSVTPDAANLAGPVCQRGTEERFLCCYLSSVQRTSKLALESNNGIARTFYKCGIWPSRPPLSLVPEVSNACQSVRDCSPGGGMSNG